MVSTATFHGTTGPPKSGLRRITLTQWILISMVRRHRHRVGLPRVGARAHRGWAATDLKLLSTIFLRMIKSLIVPLLFATLVVGIAGHGDDMKKVGRLAFRSIIYFEIVTTLALVIGLVAVNLDEAGRGRRPRRGVGAGGRRVRGDARRRSPACSSTPCPQSFFDAAAKNEVLQIVFFAIIFAVALSRVQGQTKRHHARRAARACPR